ncbi:bifunctional GNAT family N-acetyltransferase/hotdog fold thioesterase [Thalassotalea hakodatensis]|uniref:bifunctional GNAT family N-acetyltransferase/hotdog fold thioesterase n=1 Tax=Thalassotalea hakodatensis TaxID=3030492 RepID=UPI002573DCD1|nr:bifunctional GNAT family N-acetyltransferase/hotdog fold thioesterase [Thalassotalea hakodatensis]
MISCIAPQTQEQFKQYYFLRWQELRAPWRQPKGSEQDELEAIAFHRMLVDEQGKVYAVGRLHIDNEWLGHIRYVATDNNQQGKGLGKLIMLALEQLAKTHGVHTICLNARENALMFYQNIGYTTKSIAHKLYDDIQHFSMEKKLAEIPENQCSLIKSLQQKWHNTIPLSKVMGITADFYDGNTFLTHCDIAINKNIHQTMFAGSIYTLATLTGWGWVYLQINAQNIQGDIVLADGKIKYYKPIPDGANGVIKRENTSGDALQKERKGKTSFIVEVGIYTGDSLAAQFTGKYVVVKKQ